MIATRYKVIKTLHWFIVQRTDRSGTMGVVTINVEVPQAERWARQMCDKLNSELSK